MKQIALLGCGNIAGIIAAHSEGSAGIVACHDVDVARSAAFAEAVGAAHCEKIDALLASDAPLLLEAASVQAVRDHLPAALSAGKDVVVLSVGALADSAFLEHIRELAAGMGRRVHIPSGAIFGLDNIKAASVAGFDELRLRTTKPPQSLGLDHDCDRRLLFAGSAGEVVSRFPKNVNVAAALALAAGRDPDVELWVDPQLTCNRHTIEASGPFGRVSICTDNLPSPENPATSYLAALSVLALLRRMDDPIRVGT